MSVKTFFSKVEAELKKLFGSATFEQKAQSVIGYVAPIIDTVLTLADPAIEPLVANVIKTVQSDLATVSTVVQSGTAAPGSSAAATISTALNSINTNLYGLLNVAEVKNSAKITQITAAVNLIVGETNALLASAPSAPSPVAVSA